MNNSDQSSAVGEVSLVLRGEAGARAGRAESSRGADAIGEVQAVPHPAPQVVPLLRPCSNLRLAAWEWVDTCSAQIVSQLVGVRRALASIRSAPTSSLPNTFHPSLSSPSSETISILHIPASVINHVSQPLAFIMSQAVSQEYTIESRSGEQPSVLVIYGPHCRSLCRS